VFDADYNKIDAGVYTVQLKLNLYNYKTTVKTIEFTVTSLKVIVPDLPKQYYEIGKPPL
jgi:hypothetical protein